MNNNETGNLRSAVRWLCVKNWMRSDFASRSKATSKTTKTSTSASSSTKTSTYWGGELGLILNHKNIRSPIFQCRQKLINLLRHGHNMYLEKDDGASWILENKRLSSGFFLCTLNIGLTERWKSTMARGGGNKKKISVLYWCLQETICLPPSSSRSFRTQSCWSFITWQCDWFRSDFFQYDLSRWMCNQSYSPFINSGLIPGGQILSKRQTVFFLPVDPMDKESQGSWDDRLGSTASCTVHAYSMGRNIKTQFFGVDIKLAHWERIQVLSDSIECNHPSRNTPSLLYPESCSDGKWRNHIRKKYMNHLDRLRRFPWEMIGWRNWVQKLLDKQKEKLLDKQKAPNQPNQTLIQIMIERGDPLFDWTTRPVRVLRKSIHVSLLTARIPICLLNVFWKTKTQTKT